MYRLLRIASRHPKVYEYRITARPPQPSTEPTKKKGNGLLFGALTILGAHTAYVYYATYNYLQSQEKKPLDK